MSIKDKNGNLTTDFLPFSGPGFGKLMFPLDCDLVFLVPESHRLAKKDGQKIEVIVQVEPFLGSDSHGMIFDPKALAEAVDFSTVPTKEK
jgi:hypothetical protein